MSGFPGPSGVEGRRTFFEPVDATDIGMVQRGEDFRFTLKAREPIGVVRERLGQDLDRDVAAQPRIARPIDSPMPPRPIGSISSKTPRRVPGVRGKCLIIRAGREGERDYSRVYLSPDVQV